MNNDRYPQLVQNFLEVGSSVADFESFVDRDDRKHNAVRAQIVACIVLLMRRESIARD